MFTAKVSDLFYDHSVYMGVERCNYQRGKDDRGEVEEYEVIVIHHLSENALRI